MADLHTVRHCFETFEKEEMSGNQIMVKTLVRQFQDFESNQEAQKDAAEGRFTELSKAIAAVEGESRRDLEKLDGQVAAKMEDRMKNFIAEQLRSQNTIEEHISQKNFDLSQKINRLESVMADEIKRIVSSETRSSQHFERVKGELNSMLMIELSKFNMMDKSERGKVHEKVINVLQQRKEDLSHVTEIISIQATKTQAMVEKAKEQLQQKFEENIVTKRLEVAQMVREAVLDTEYKQLEAKIRRSLDFKEFVRVTEVQDALKQITETFQRKLLEKETKLLNTVQAAQRMTQLQPTDESRLDASEVNELRERLQVLESKLESMGNLKSSAAAENRLMSPDARRPSEDQQ
jgi:hypothetical protein